MIRYLVDSPDMFAERKPCRGIGSIMKNYVLCDYRDNVGHTCETRA